MWKVLVVDDMEVILRQMKRLKIWGDASGFVLADEARDGQEALEKLRANPVDLVITDVRMPKIDGIELLQKIMERKLASCVVFLSDYGEFTYAREGFRSGAFDYILKPVEGEKLLSLLERVRQYLEQKQQERDRIRELEEKLVEKMEAFYPATYIKQITGQLSEGSLKAVETIDIMVEATWAALEHDRLKTAVILQNALTEIWNAIEQQLPWLRKFFNAEQFTGMDLTRYPDWPSMKSAVREVVGRTASHVGRLGFDSTRSSTVGAVCRYVLENVEKEISLAVISEALYISKSHVSEGFKQKTGMTVGAYITRIKMERAKKLLSEGLLKNYEIADRLHYKDIEYFGRIFKKYSGLSPTEFKQKEHHLDGSKTD